MIVIPRFLCTMIAAEYTAAEYAHREQREYTESTHTQQEQREYTRQQREHNKQSREWYCTYTEYVHTVEYLKKIETADMTRFLISGKNIYVLYSVYDKF